MLHDLEQLAIVIAGGFYRSDVGLADLAARAGDECREADGGIGLQIVGAATAVGGDFRVIELGEMLAGIGVGREAILAAIDLRDGKRDALAGLRRQGAACPAYRRGRDGP